VEWPFGHMRWDVTAQGGRCTGGICRGARMRVMAPLNVGNHGDDTSGHAAGEGSGRGLTLWHTGPDGAIVLGWRGEKQPAKIFQF
jgi:hypothetical protein